MSEYSQLEARVLEFIEDGDAASFDVLALEIHAFQKSQCAPLRAYCESMNAAPQNWREIPAVPTEAFKNPTLPITSFPVTEATKTFLTSGTSGESRGAHHFKSTAIYEQSVKQSWQQLDLPTLPLICLSQPPAIAGDSSLVHMFATLGGRFAIGSDGVLDPQKLATLIKASSKPILLAGTALAFLNLFESGHEIPILPEGSWTLETGGYKGSGREVSKADLYALFEQHLGLPPDRVINEYGMTELSTPFYTHGLGRPHRAPHWLRAQVIEPGTDTAAPDGESGVLSICDLANLGSSIGIMTRDLAIRRGDTFELIGRDPAAIPRGCSRSADEMLSSQR